MFWAQDIYAFQCISDPTCIRPEDYTPAQTPEFRRELPEAEEMGVTPMWKIFATTYVGLTRFESRMELNLVTVGGETDHSGRHSQRPEPGRSRPP